MSLAKYDCRLFVIDLKRVDFSVYKKIAWYAYTTSGALQVLRYLKEELIIRQDILDKAGVVKIQDYPGYLPYCVLIIDELMQLTPKFAADKHEKSMREEAHGCLTDILGLARALGIHVILGTQGAYRDILPGEMKINIPARLAFRCATPEGSEIILGKGKYDAYYLPEIPGRAIWQYGTEHRTVQVMHIPHQRVKMYLPDSKPVLKPGQERVDGGI